MGALFDILAAPIMLPTKGLLFIFDKITEQVNNEILDDSNIRLQLLELESLLESGQISEEEFYEMEEELLDRLDAILAYKEEQQRRRAVDEEDEEDEEDENAEDVVDDAGEQARADADIDDAQGVPDAMADYYEKLDEKEDVI